MHQKILENFLLTDTLCLINKLLIRNELGKRIAGISMRFCRIDNTHGDQYIIAREGIISGASHRYKVVIYTVAREESNKTGIILLSPFTAFSREQPRGVQRVYNLRSPPASFTSKAFCEGAESFLEIPLLSRLVMQ